MLSTNAAERVGSNASFLAAVETIRGIADPLRATAVVLPALEILLRARDCGSAGPLRRLQRAGARARLETHKIVPVGAEYQWL